MGPEHSEQTDADTNWPVLRTNSDRPRCAANVVLAAITTAAVGMIFSFRDGLEAKTMTQSPYD